MTNTLTQPISFETTTAQRPAGHPEAPRNKAIWSGRILSSLAILFLAFDASVKLAGHPLAIEGTRQLGYPADSLLTIGLIECICLALYLIPRTAPLGAVLWTGYLGGAIATHFRIGDPLFSHTLFPIYVAAILWGGLWFRDRRVKALLSSAR
jgi:hypothetical protein